MFALSEEGPRCVVWEEQPTVLTQRLPLSRLTVEPLTKDLARRASDLLKSAGLHGHKYAIDAVVTATAITTSDKPARILTSDPDDLEKLLGKCLDRSSLERGADNSKVKVFPV
ncbi:hypothetical protein [Actinacidiphila oryziradicis]|uniref:PIN domain-containing protein n=1 Tax=Actinacidiphila oryziradicis TaxID=2571141 RepID=A0A4U0SM57_9ACTN|nr:hypothetical protein [Actinacidiphila oryziradicis]TKA10138.1 hypothetical protein FCI23_18185 [Actinacidiphila oryziradicis]